MARIKYASIIASASGSVGSATFQKSLYGDILRNKPRPRKSASPLQLTRRNLMMTMHNEWSELTPAQRKQWNQFIAYSGATIRRDKNVLTTGHALFIQYNYLRLLANFDVLTDPGYAVLPPNYGTIGLSLTDLGVLTLYVFAESMDTEQWFAVKLSNPRKTSLSFSARGLKYIPLTHSAGEDWPIQTLYSAIFGALPAKGDTLHYSIRWFSVTAPVLTGIFSGIAIVEDGDL